MNLLVVEDDPSIGKALERGFRETGHDCTLVRDGRKGLAEGLSQRFDTIILDLMLPEMPGLDVLRQLREAGNRTPVILLTALGSVAERVAGLNAGADDYLVKPFAFDELTARLEAVSRRAAVKPSAVLKEGGLTLDLSSRRVEGPNGQLDLTPTEFSLLELLLRHAGQVVGRKAIYSHLWPDEEDAGTNLIEVHVNRLRGKLDKAGLSTVIQTVRGRGYAFRSPS
jgi:two-component system OmpR family response regulator/two-component system copper resistance phosphate regulon response regulator CusR